MSAAHWQRAHKPHTTHTPHLQAHRPLPCTWHANTSPPSMRSRIAARKTPRRAPRGRPQRKHACQPAARRAASGAAHRRRLPRASLLSLALRPHQIPHPPVRFFKPRRGLPPHPPSLCTPHPLLWPVPCTKAGGGRPGTHLTLVRAPVLRGGSLPAGPRSLFSPNQPHRYMRLSTHIPYCIGGSCAGSGPRRRTPLPGRRSGSTCLASLLLRSPVCSW